MAKPGQDLRFPDSVHCSQEYTSLHTKSVFSFQSWNASWKSRRSKLRITGWNPRQFKMWYWCLWALPSLQKGPGSSGQLPPQSWALLLRSSSLSSQSSPPSPSPQWASHFPWAIFQWPPSARAPVLWLFTHCLLALSSSAMPQWSPLPRAAPQTQWPSTPRLAWHC